MVGGTDPADDPGALEDLEIIRSCPDTARDADEKARLDAFAEALERKDSLPGVSRRVVLARGQRYLLRLSMALDDLIQEQPKPKKRGTGKSDRRAAPTPATPYDPALLELPGVGPKTASRLASRGIASPTDLLFWLPRRYDDRRTVTPIADLKPGMRVVTRGTVERVSVYGRPWRRIMEIKLKDGDATLSGTYFSNRRPRTDRFSKGDEITLAGLVGKYKGRLQIAHPIVVSDGEGSDRVGRVVPVYAEVPDVPGRTVEKAVGAAARLAGELVGDPMPKEILERRVLVPLAEALELVHLPPHDVSPEDLDAWIDGSSPAHRRLAYDEFFYIQLALALRRRETSETTSRAIPREGDVAVRAGELMGLTPTGAQARVIREIVEDMDRDRPMRRLLQGDVGSGKTLVALAAIAAAAKAGYQTALMAPTEILAEQHMRTLGPILEGMGIRTVLHIGQARSSTRKKSLKALESGVARVAIGTHALIQESVSFSKLALAIVDEQHRFGVAQRLGLVGKGPDGTSPHLLVMTATPIPRTLALTVHGDLDVSVLDELPPGRTPIETVYCPEDERDTALEALGEAVADGGQAYVVCPIIEESEKLDLRPAEAVHEEIAERFGPEAVGIIHGRLPAEERDAAMDDFIAGRTRILVATTVIEVGVDVPNATFMMIEGAHRFGLAQLHQLRGRVGRGSAASMCYLVADPSGEDALARMEVLARTTDGFRISEEDLRIRGPGELYGKRQAGLPGFRFGNLARDGALLEDARRDVAEIAEADPDLAGDRSAALREELGRRIIAGDGPVGEESG